MKTCSLHRRLEIVPGTLADYTALAGYHYRPGRPVGIVAIFALTPVRPLDALGRRTLGVVVYTMPRPRVELRRTATGRLFQGFDRQTQLAIINSHIRCLSRIIIEPRLRGIGLAIRLVRETLPRLNVPIVEALGVMPKVNPFLEKAGMKAYTPMASLAQVELVEALHLAGIEDNELVDPSAVQKKLDALSPSGEEFVEIRVQQFLKSHGRRRDMPGGIDRTRYVLAQLADRSAYHIWFHPTLELRLP